MKAGELELQLNAEKREDRLAALREIRRLMDEKKIARPPVGTDTNNHVHSFYSFSPYSPSMIVYKACMSGLSTIGLMDHDSVSGAKEFFEAGEIIDIPTTVGTEVRMDFAGTRLEGMQLDYIEQKSIGYNTMNGISRNQLDALEPMLADVREKRNIRNRAQVDKLNGLIEQFGIAVSFEEDVVPLSKMQEGGSITDRHILFALAKKFIGKYGKGEGLIRFLGGDIGLPLSDKVLAMLRDVDFYAYDYDVLNLLKGYYTPKMILPCENDTLDVKKTIPYMRSLGVIPCRCYLGDVAESVTGDKPAMKAEDDYLDLFFEESKALGFESMAYIPTRNTMEQLRRVMELSDKYEMLQICGEDINQPRQSFITEKLRLPEFAHLEHTTWAVIGSGKAAEKDVALSFVSDQTKQRLPKLQDRIAYFEKIGRGGEVL